jgi:outer membrane protein assembly factor BamB
MVVDPRAGNVFLSGGDGTTFIQVFEPSGGVLKLIENEHDVWGMTIHGTNLYALRQDTIHVIDTEALEFRRSIPIPETETSLIAMAGGRLWFTAKGCNYELKGEVTGVTPADGSLITIPDAAPYCAGTASPDPAGNVLFTYGRLGSRTTLTRWDVSTTPPTAVVSRRLPTGGSPTFSHDGRVVYIPHYRGAVDAYSAHDLTRLWTHETGVDFASAATDVSPDGSLLATGYYLPNEPYEDPDLYVHSTGGGRERDTTDLFGEYPVVVQGQGVHFGPDGHTVYVAANEEGADDGSTEHGQVKLYTIGVQSPVPGEPTKLTLSVKPSGRGRYEVTCASAGTLPNERVHLLRSSWYGVRRARILRMNEHGRCHATIRKTTAGALVAAFGGKPGLAPSRSAPVSVAGTPAVTAELLGGTGRHGRYRLYRRRATPVVRGSVQPIEAERLLAFRVQARLDGEWATADREAFRMSQRGEVFATLKRGKSQVPYRVRTEYRGGGGPALVSPWSYFKLGPHRFPPPDARAPAGAPARGRGRIRWSEAVVDRGWRRR